MLNHSIDTVVVGADRIIVNSDLINKVGTCFIIVVAIKIKNLFYEVTLVVSANFNRERGQDIYTDDVGIEDFKGYGSKRWGSENANVYNPMFDIVLVRYNSDSITKKGITPSSVENNFEILSYEK